MDTEGLPKSRSEAKALKAKYYFTGEPCKHGHISPRKTRGACLACLKIEWANAKETRAEYNYMYARREKTRARQHKWYMANRERVIRAAATRPVEALRRYRNNWKKNNALQVLADNRVRKRRHRQATPPWISRKQKTEMRQIYEIAITMTQTTGERYVVDHIIPLRSEFVCGLHVPWNLRVITQDENLRKSNKLVDTPID
jgi:5-methylcytosine-specific restriction endonuclease McrA